MVQHVPWVTTTRILFHQTNVCLISSCFERSLLLETTIRGPEALSHTYKQQKHLEDGCLHCGCLAPDWRMALIRPFETGTTPMIWGLITHHMFASYFASLKVTYRKLSWVCWKIRFISLWGSFCLCSKANWVACAYTSYTYNLQVMSCEWWSWPRPPPPKTHLVGGVIAAGAWSHSMTFPGEWVGGGSNVFFVEKHGKRFQIFQKIKDSFRGVLCSYCHMFLNVNIEILLIVQKSQTTTWDVSIPVNNGIRYLSTGAGCLPSTAILK